MSEDPRDQSHQSDPRTICDQTTICGDSATICGGADERASASDKE